MLVAHEPVDARLGGSAKLALGHVRTALGWRDDSEREDQQQGQREQRRPDAPHPATASGRRASRTVGSSKAGSANQAVSGSRLRLKAIAALPRIVVPSRSTTSSAAPDSMRKRASQSSARTAFASRRWPGSVTSTRSTRSRVEGTAQTTSTAMARNEKT